jgi:hypothetical protein
MPKYLPTYEFQTNAKFKYHMCNDFFSEAKAEAEKRMAEAKALAGDKCSIQ